MKLKSLLFFLAAMMPLSISAEKLVEKETGLPLNQKTPEIQTYMIDGNPATLADISGDKGAILVFYRSADWCSFCKKHLIEINGWNQKFNDIGYKFAGISYDSTDILKTFSDAQNIAFPLLSDPQSKTIISYNILNTEQKPGSKGYGIPFPGIMLINPEGVLTYKYFYEGYKDRVNLEELYNSLK
ncbi:MAG: peroxiredoxin family protein [Gammaproteobacteria bacterium]|nr:peroxiredoxin family protein [Gammaproteobacteria bacterium]MDH5628613.1 peroxiredoxin family protein [Gammaproteobacteria bacterium]